MEWSAIQKAFQEWEQALAERTGSSLSVVRSLPGKHDGVRVALVFYSGLPDPERKMHQRIRQRQEERRPVARFRYVAAVSAAEPERAENLLIHLMMCVDREMAMQVLSEPVPPDWWRANEAKPMPAFQFEVSVSEALTADPAPPVQKRDFVMNVVGSPSGEE